MKLHLAYHKEKTSVSIQNETVAVKGYQIIVWVSVTLRSILQWDNTIPKIPAILDIGNTHTFAISHEQLHKWARVHPGNLELLKKMREKKEIVPMRAASLWLHGNESFRLSIDEGIGVYEQNGPRLPILGLRALTNSKLQTLIYGDQFRAVIQTPRKWYWPF